jgi:acyl-coenzyme A thioesterase PaaI-like protein
VADPNHPHAGGGFNPPEPTTSGGPDYGRFVEAVRTLQDHTRAADAPDDVITNAADMIEAVNGLLAPFEADEWTTPSGRRMDLPNRGNLLQVPSELETVDDEVDGSVRFRRYHLGRNGAVHGGAVAQMWDSVLGFAAFRLSRSFKQRTAYLHVNYRQIVPLDTALGVAARADRSEGRKIFVAGRLFDGDMLLCDAEALFVKLNPGQP